MSISTPILIVDDDAVSLHLLADRLKAAGHEVALASDGNEAFDLCRKLRVDLVIADWIMPGMDGLELCRILKADPSLRQMYFILLTARESLSDRVRALDSGADEYLIKPCADEEILARVRAGLRIHRLQEELAAMAWRLATRELGAALGHAINNPLAVIANYLEMLEQRLNPGEAEVRPPSEETRNLLTGAHREVDRIAEVIRRLVNLRDPARVPTPLGLEMTDLEGKR